MLVALSVSIIWGLATLAAIITKDSTTLGIVTPVMLIIVGGLMAARERKNGKNGHAA